MARRDIARKRRRDPTDAEKRLWRHLRNRQIEGAKFRREEPVLGYFADFLCEDARLIVEADGGQHEPKADAERTAALEAAGYTVIRFWNHEILSNTEGVIEEIRRMLKLALPPLP
jgi:very-short-patch-repair endonuclease